MTAITRADGSLFYLPLILELKSPEVSTTSGLLSGGADGTRMRADNICFDLFQTKTSASGEKVSSDRGVDEVSHRSQTSAIRLDGSKGENPRSQVIAKALAEAKSAWLESGSHSALRTDLLRLLVSLENQHHMQCTIGSPT